MKKHCAIYTRKSTEERLDIKFNTLNAQREACEAYITSQKSEGWIVSAQQYNDGGFSGGSLERPALNKLLKDIKTGKIQIIVVYKIDRLTRSLMDFAKLVEIFDEYGVTFVSITQSFNTTTSMGRLTLNVLLSFAQFEREIASERMQDKIAASKAKGMWMGGKPPLGFDIEDSRLVINEDAEKAKSIFELYLELGCVRKLKRELENRDIKSKERISKKGLKYGGCFFSRGALYSLLQNPVYIGKISHKGNIHEGLHNAIISDELWTAVQNKLENQRVNRRKNIQRKCLLQGLIHDAYGSVYSPAFNKKRGKHYCYYISQKTMQHEELPANTPERLPANEIEKCVEKIMRKNIKQLLSNTKEQHINYILKHQEIIPTSDLIKSCISYIMINNSEIHITVSSQGLINLIKKHLGIDISTRKKKQELKAFYKKERIDHGKIVFRLNCNDIFDLPPPQLKKLTQGIIWRDEHFSGVLICDIAKREGYSNRYVRNVIMQSFDTLLST